MWFDVVVIVVVAVVDIDIAFAIIFVFAAFFILTIVFVIHFSGTSKSPTKTTPSSPPNYHRIL